jgi:DNA polymerase-3 subunit beta
MVSTDGHRLSKVDRDLPGAPKLSAGVIIPKKGLLEIKKILDGAATCKLAVKTPHAFFAVDDLVLAVKLIDAQFPPYEQVIPKDHKRRATISRDSLTDAVKRAQLMSSEARGVKMSFASDHITIASDSPTSRGPRERPVQERGVTIGFSKYMIELLGQIKSDQVDIDLGGELDPRWSSPLGRRLPRRHHADAHLGLEVFRKDPPPQDVGPPPETREPTARIGIVINPRCLAG